MLCKTGFYVEVKGASRIVKQVGLDSYLLSLDGRYRKTQQTQQYGETYGHTFHINIEYR